MREKSRKSISALIGKEATAYAQGSPIELPFGFVFPFERGSRSYLDLQIEGVGTKTLLAELAGDYRSIGIDAVAMAANDVIRSGAKPILMSDAIHVARSEPSKIASIIAGVREGAKLSGALLCSGETGDVAEILHAPYKRSALPFDIFVSVLGTVDRGNVVYGRISKGDVVIAMESSGIHSNGLTLARKILLKNWGGVYEPDERPAGLGRKLIAELLEPTRIYVGPLLEAMEKSRIKAAIHITGDGFFKFGRLIEFQRKISRTVGEIGFKFDSLGPLPSIYRLLEGAAEESKHPISRKEMFRTFNMGFGFAVVVSKEQEETVVSSFRRWFPARRIGTVTPNRSILLEGAGKDGETIVFR